MGFHSIAAWENRLVIPEGQAREKEGQRILRNMVFIEPWRPPAPGFLLRKK